jgi:PhoD-like phosphatase
MAQLVLGPVLRYVDERQATVWVETDGPCEAEVLGCRARTFHVAGHHYALVHVTGLEPGSTAQYQVLLDGEQRWPEPGSPFPPSVIRTPAPDRPAKLVFGSCRVSAPHEPPHTLRKDQDENGREVDALHALALRMCEQPMTEWPDRLLMLGDQVYADEVSPRTLERISERRDTSRPPHTQIADFEEYTWLYLESWGEPVMRWLLSTIASAMIFDDHDVVDDWNISESWIEDIRRLDWWEDRITGAFMSYWIYQHLGNLAPEHLHEDEMYDTVRGTDDATSVLRDFAHRADRETEGTRWSYCRDYGGVRVVVIDSRAGRTLRDGRRSMVDDDEWDWICDRLVGGHDHLVLATTLPLLLGHGMHFLEAWNEAVCDGAWGATAARLGEKVRRGIDLEHWAAFSESFARVTNRLQEIAAGEHGPPPASITVLSGDVHHAYLSEVAFPRSAGARTPVWQIVCSPFRNPLDKREQRMIRFGTSRTAHAIGRALARSAGVTDPPVRWRMVDGPFFDNQVATLELHGRSARITLERTPRTGELRLAPCFTRALA